MRIDLTTTYPERHEAKALGARWDAFKRCWYVVDPPDLTPFMGWIPSAHPGSLATGASDKPKGSHIPPNRNTAMKAERRAAFNNRARITGTKNVPHCGCNALPWEHCAHTQPAT
jgi:hypothetical protein